jgi:Flp pilus assembly secretin CpaC
MIRTLFILTFVLFNSARVMAQSTEVRTQARVFEVNRSRLKDLGIPIRAVSAERLESDFVVNISESSLQSLISSPGSRQLQNIQLTTVGESPAQFRIASRVSASQPSAESQRFDVGFDFRFLTQVSMKREIAMTIISQAKIRNLDIDGAESATPILGEAIRHEIITAEGASVAAGGFVTDVDAQQLSRIATLRDSPVLKYLFPAENQDPTELLIVLTPHIVRAADVPTSAPVPRPAQPAVEAIVTPVPKKNDTRTAQFSVQVAAFKTEAKANAYAMELSGKYPDVFVDVLEAPAKGLFPYRIRVGHLGNVNAAKELERQLRRDGLEPLVLMLNQQ